jgi:hypothetical protein
MLYVYIRVWMVKFNICRVVVNACDAYATLLALQKDELWKFMYSDR